MVNSDNSRAEGECRTNSEEEKIFQALLELVKEGHLNWAQAISEMKKELGCSVLYLQYMGYIDQFKVLDRPTSHHL